MKTNYAKMCIKRFALLACVLAPLTAIAGPVTFTQLSIRMSPGVNATAYPTVTSEHDDAITGAESPCCTAVELHTHAMDGDIMRMRRVARLRTTEPPIFFVAVNPTRTVGSSSCLARACITTAPLAQDLPFAAARKSGRTLSRIMGKLGSDIRTPQDSED